jgi:predicted GNAT family acetyltransferase
MIVWSVLLGLSIIGIFSVPFIRSLRVENSTNNQSEDLNLQKNLNNVKNLVREVAKGSGENLGKGLKSVYEKGLLKVNKTRVSGLINGQGILKNRNTNSDFLKNVKEHKDKVREELTNGNGKVKDNIK